MTLIGLVSGYIGVPNNYAGEVVIYTLCALILLVVIEEIAGFLHITWKNFK
jgi:hypothetical protein